MNQKNVSSCLLNGINSSLPKGISHRIEHTNDVVGIFFESPKKNIILELTSDYCEISLFLNDLSNKSSWHTHLEFFTQNGIEDQVNKSISIITNLFSEKIKIIRSKILGTSLEINKSPISGFFQLIHLAQPVLWTEV